MASQSNYHANQNFSISKIKQQIQRIIFQQNAEIDYYRIQLQKCFMFDWLRRIVAGAKNRTVEGDFDLDLTYITPNIIAMAYPASGFQQIYRNRIDDVSNFLNRKHLQSYYVINVSDRSYDSLPFENRVQQYPWPDHQAPCLTTLFEIVDYTAQRIKESDKNVIAVHCNHGKGRTGTAIMSILLFSNPNFETIEQVLNYYNKQRFSKQQYKVQQPCQVRYLQFFKHILDCPQPYQQLKAYRINRVSHEGLGNGYYLRISHIRDRKIVLPRVEVQSYNSTSTAPLMGDIFIEIMEKGILCDTRMARINYHLSFLMQDKGSQVVSLKGTQVAVSLCQKTDFSITITFEQFCKCHQIPNIVCLCMLRRELQSQYWCKMHRIIESRSSSIGSVQQIKLVLNTENKLE